MQQTTIEMERTLLATIMLRPGDCFRVEMVAEAFLVEDHADLYTAIRDLSNDAKPCDPVSVADYLQQRHRKSLGDLAIDIANEAMITAVPDHFAFRVMESWRQRRAREIGRELVESPDPKAVDKAIADLMNLHAVEQNHEWDAKSATKAAYEHLMTVYRSNGELPGLDTGLNELNEKLGGFHKGDLVVVGGRAAMGKTAFLGGLARSAALGGKPVGIISGEQPVAQMAMRNMSAMARIDARTFRNAAFTEAEWPQVTRSMEDSMALPMFYFDRSAPTVAEVIRIARRWKHKHGIQALYIDYLQRIEGEGDKRYEKVGYVARSLKNLARDLDIPVIVLAQVSRAVEQRANQCPRMGDLSDSSEIEKEADQVLMIYRPGYYDHNAPQDVAQIVVEKNRHGPTGFVDVKWTGAYMLFSDLEDSSSAWGEM